MLYTRETIRADTDNGNDPLFALSLNVPYRKAEYLRVTLEDSRTRGKELRHILTLYTRETIRADTDNGNDPLFALSLNVPYIEAVYLLVTLEAS